MMVFRVAVRYRCLALSTERPAPCAPCAPQAHLRSSTWESGLDSMMWCSGRLACGQREGGRGWNVVRRPLRVEAVAMRIEMCPPVTPCTLRGPTRACY